MHKPSSVPLTVCVLTVPAALCVDSRCSVCPPSWRWWRGHCYFFSVGLENNRRRNESAEFCRRRNSSLAVIKDSAEMVKCVVLRMEAAGVKGSNLTPSSGTLRQQAKEQIPLRVPPSTGLYSRCNEELDPSPVSVVGTHRRPAGGTVAVVGRGRHPALHAVSPE